jgi:hypothetical protein
MRLQFGPVYQALNGAAVTHQAALAAAPLFSVLGMGHPSQLVGKDGGFFRVLLLMHLTFVFAVCVVSTGLVG